MQPVLRSSCQPACRQMDIQVSRQQYALKKSTEVVHTEGEPPNSGKAKRANKGCTQNRRNAPEKMLAAYKSCEGV